MTLDPTSTYGTVVDVAYLTTIYTNAGSYDATTRPSIAAVESWITSCSATINTLMAEQGFVTPVTNAAVKATLAGMVVQVVADLCHAANSAGRFFTDRAIERGINPMQVVQNEMANFIRDHAQGFEAQGAAKSSGGTGAIVAYRETNDAGSVVEPLFKRGEWGGR